MNPMHNKLIISKSLQKYKDVLSRKYYTQQLPTSKLVDAQLSAKNKLMFMPIDVRDDLTIQDSPYSKATYKLVLFGVLQDGRRASVILNNIRPYIEIQVPLNSSIDNLKNNIWDALNNVDSNIFKKAGGRVNYSDEMTINDNSDANTFNDIYTFSIPHIAQSPDDYTVSYGKYFKEYNESQSAFIRIEFYKLKDRRNAIIYLNALNMRVVHDDLNNYYRVVCRDYLLSFNVWCTISNYSILSKNNSNMCAEVLFNAENSGLIFSLNVANYTQYPQKDIDNELQRDPTLSMCWDCEMYKPYAATDKGVPMPDNPNHKIFMIGATFQWYHSAGNQQLLRICFVDKSTLPHPDYLSIVCADECDLLFTFIRVWGWMSPDLVLGFNDGEYDYPWLHSRVCQYNLLSTMVKQISMAMPYEYTGDDGKSPWLTDSLTHKYYRSTQYKLEADMAITCHKYYFAGVICIDVRTIFRQLFPTDEASSLNHYLTRLNIPTKLDINFKDMFDMYEEMTALENSATSPPQHLLTLMQQVAHYCVIDAQRCHELMHKLYVIMDKRAISHMAYVSFQDAIERANGMKVRNLIIAAGQQKPFLLRFNNNSVYLGGADARAKYPGAYVFPPIKGLVNGKLSIDERIKLGMPEWHNIDSTLIEITKKIIADYGRAQLTKDEVQQCMQKYGTLPKCIIDFLTEIIKRPITGLDFNSLYPSLMMTYNLSPEYMITDRNEAKKAAQSHTLHPIKFEFGGRKIRGWAVRHDGYTDPTDPKFKFGIFGYVLKQLFDRRKLIKADMKNWNHIVETAPSDSQEFQDALFQYEYLNSTQKALKIFMNTFYGEIGNQLSPFFMVQVAGGITTNGGKNVKAAQSFVEQKGCRVYYGDTDSIYSSMPDSYFTNIDIAYFTNKISKLEYWCKMVDITLEVIANIRDEINEYFYQCNGTRFLTMAFEEVLFPVLFASKKKYVGIAHEHKPSFAESINISDLRIKLLADISIKNPEYDPTQLLTAVDNAIIARRKKRFFIRGLDVVKRGMPNFAKEIILDILDQMVDINNTLELFDIVQQKIISIYTTKWDDHNILYKFVMTDQFKPHKKNQKMHVFVARMAELYGVHIKPFERVRYIIAQKNPYKYDIRGRTGELPMGERMELADLAAEYGHIIDINEYMRSKVCGQLARLIAYRPEFIPELEPQYISTNTIVNTTTIVNNNDAALIDAALIDDEQSKLLETSIYDMATKWVNKFCDQYAPKYMSLAAIHKDVSKSATIITKRIISNINPNGFGTIQIGAKSRQPKSITFAKCLKPLTDDEMNDNQLITYIDEMARAAALGYLNISISEMGTRRSKRPTQLRQSTTCINAYISLYKCKCNECNKIQSISSHNHMRPINQKKLDNNKTRAVYNNLLNMTISHEKIYRRIFNIQHSRHLINLQKNLCDIRRLHMQINNVVINLADYIMQNNNIDDLLQSGIDEHQITERRQKINTFIYKHFMILHNNANKIIDDNNRKQLTDYINTYNTIFIELTSLYKFFELFSDIQYEAQLYRDKFVGHTSVKINQSTIEQMIHAMDT